MSRDIRQLEQWIEEHPVHARFTTIGLAIFTLELAELFKYGVEWVVRCAQ